MIPKFKKVVEKYSESQVLRHGSTSTNVPVNNSHSSSPTVRNARGQAKMVSELEPEPTPETQQPTRSPSLPATSNTEQNSMILDDFRAQDNSDSDSEPVLPQRRTPRSKLRPSSERKSRMLRELEGHNESPDRELESKQKGRQQKRPLSKAKSSPRKSARRSQLLREIDDYNKSPEAEERHDLAMARTLVNESRLTRGTRRSLLCAARNETPEPRESLNLRALMKAEFKGAGKGTKRFQSEGNSDLSRNKKQRKDTTDLLFLGDEEDDEEETLPNTSQTHDRGHSQSTPTRQLSPKQVGKAAGSSQGNGHQDESSAESAWSAWDSRKGQ